jgi:hypothetical protein
MLFMALLYMISQVLKLFMWMLHGIIICKFSSSQIDYVNVTWHCYIWFLKFSNCLWKCCMALLYKWVLRCSNCSCKCYMPYGINKYKFFLKFITQTVYVSVTWHYYKIICRYYALVHCSIVLKFVLKLFMWMHCNALLYVTEGVSQ